MSDTVAQPVRQPEAPAGLREPQRGRGAAEPQLTVKADCNAPSGRCSVDTYSFESATADMTKEPVVVKWVD
jgi:hypothetical protein